MSTSTTSTQVTPEEEANSWFDEQGVRYSQDGKKLIEGHKNLQTYVVREGTEVICDGAFWDCSSLSSISLPNSLTSIGEWAFSKCSSLSSISLPNSLTTIGARAFEWCKSLSSITLPNSLTTIGESAFSKCSSLSSITLPNSLTSIGEWAFSDCSSLSSITLPNSLTTIGARAFSDCSSLSSITLPNSLTTIGGGAFAGCESLRTLENHSPRFFVDECCVYDAAKTKLMTCWNDRVKEYRVLDGVREIGERAFSSCSSLSSITLPNSLTSIGEYAFSWCESLRTLENHSPRFFVDECCVYDAAKTKLMTCWNNTIKEYRVLDGVREIGESAFRGCESLSSITLPNSLTSIGERVFSWCSSLSSITLPNSLTTIGEYAFLECSSLETIHIPRGQRERFEDMLPSRWHDQLVES